MWVVSARGDGVKRGSSGAEHVELLDFAWNCGCVFDTGKGLDRRFKGISKPKWEISAKEKRMRMKKGCLVIPKLVILFLAGSIILSSCQNSAGPQSSSSSSTSTSATVPAAVTASIGYGYDVFGEYANASALKVPVLDYSKMSSAGVVSVTNVDAAKTYEVTGNSKAAYSRNLSVNVGLSGSYLCFSGSLDAAFRSASSTTDTYSYMTMQTYVRRISAQIGTSYTAAPASLRPYLTAAAQAAIDGTDSAYSDPSTLFAGFGTHILVWSYYGGRLDYNSVTDTTLYTGSTDASLIAQASFEGHVASASVSASAEYAADYASFSSNTTATLTIVGGNSVGGLSADATTLNPSEYDAWKADFGNSQNQILCDFDKSSGSVCLLPIWSLCDTSTAAGLARQTALKNAFNAYAQSRNAFVLAGALTVKLYHIYENEKYPNDAGWNGLYTWTYGYNFEGTNQTGTLYTKSWPSVVGVNNYLNFRGDGTVTVNGTDQATYYPSTQTVTNVTALTAVVIPVSIPGISDPNSAQYTMIYHPSSDSFTLKTTGLSNPPYYFGTDTLVQGAGSQNCPAADSGTSFNLTRGGPEQIIDLVCGWTPPGWNVAGYLFTKVGFIWN